jgi:hypothetical protein
MRPLSNARALVWALAPVLFLACDNGHVNLGPGGPGSGDSRGGAGGGPGEGTGGHAPTGSGGASTGIGGSLPNSGGGGVSTGAGGNTSGGGGVSSGGTAGGAVGAGGSGAVCGSMGEVTVCPSTFVCGNGTRDVCALQWVSFNTCQKSQVQDACDGTDFGGATCTSVGGYPTGTLRCSSKCQFDTSGCNACSEDPAVVRCGVKPTTLLPSFMSIGASDSLVALAWAGANDANPTLRFTLLTPDLDLVNNVSVKEQDLASVAYGSSWVAIAPIPTGWVVAGGGYLGDELYLHTFDAGGAHGARTAVPTVSGLNLPVVLVPRPNDGPLLFWEELSSESAVYAAVVAADGRSTTTRVEVPVDGQVEEIGQGTYAGGAFYVPLVVIKTDLRTHLQIAKLSASGAPVSVVEPFPDLQPMQDITARLPRLQAVAGGLALSYKANLQLPTASFPDTFAVQPLDLSGNPTSNASVVGGRSIKMASAVAVGDDVVSVLLDGTVPLTDDFFGESLEVMRVSPAGELGPKHPLLAARFLYNSWFDAVAVGDDVIVAWLDTSSQLQLIHARP